jgi:ABC-2 type transport system permease protein/lipopolysaccharide transport system permease protein
MGYLLHKDFILNLQTRKTVLMDCSVKGSDLAGAFLDIRDGWQRRELWLTLGWRDILSRYRRSWLGPFWIILSMGILAGVMGTLYSAIMLRPFDEYIPYLLVGFVCWGLFSALITEGCQAFTGNAAAIQEIPIPNSVYVYRLVWRNLLVLAHNIITYIVFLLVFQISPFPAVFFAVPGLVLILLNGMWIGLVFGIINARFRDFSQLINNLMRLFFFVTPIIWHAESATGFRRAFVSLNPFYYFVEILRAPLLGEVPGQFVWEVVLAITLIGWLGTLPIYARWRLQITYWV